MIKIIEHYYAWFNSYINDILLVKSKEEVKSLYGNYSYDFYNLIINAYDTEKDEKLKTDIRELFRFYQMFDNFGHIMNLTGRYSTVDKPIEVSKYFFEGSKASFDWFNPSSFLVADNLVTRRVNYADFLVTKSDNPGLYCKAYLSIKPEKYVNTIIKIQKFLDELFNNLKENEKVGQCKFRVFPSNDAIVMRFYSKEHYKLFLKFLDENKEIMDAYDNPNPFLPVDNHGLSIICDNGNSYNNFLSSLLWDYMVMCKYNDEKINLDDLLAFISNYESPDIENEILEEFKFVLKGKLTKVEDEKLLPVSFKNRIIRK